MGPKSRWFWAAVLFSVAFFGLALSEEVYVVTSPPLIAYHVLLRKVYSVAAFALVAFCIDRSLGTISAWGATVRLAVIMAAYSAAIELAQFANGSLEGLGWNIVDVLCGVFGAVVARTASALLQRATGRR